LVIAILYALGVSAGAILLLVLAVVLLKRVRVLRDPRVFEARVRVSAGAFPGLKDTWKRCRGAWVTTVLTTRTGGPLAISDVLPAERLDGVRDAGPADGIRGLGEAPIVATFTLTTGATLELAFKAEVRSTALEPWSTAEPSASRATTPASGISAT
jgi:hypothetical protein